MRPEASSATSAFAADVLAVLARLAGEEGGVPLRARAIPAGRRPVV
jgi:hypothetical protein